jgi:O-acetyl-ADP-ribose deacetylase (regulator of RNase III)
MIKYVAGDILLSRAAAIAHGVGPGDHFNSGLALALRERWPSMAKDFRHWDHQTTPKPGSIWAWAGPGARVVCLLTQNAGKEGSGHPGVASTHNLNVALRELRHWVEKEGIASIALPRLATGVGALDWAEVKPLIEEHLGGGKFKVYVYEKYAANVAADEG